MKFDEKTLSLFRKFLIVCEDNYSRISEEYNNHYSLLDEYAIEDYNDQMNHYLYLYLDIKKHTGLISEKLEPALKDLDCDCNCGEC